MATRQGACGFGGETLAGAKNACDTVVAAFFDVNHACYRDAFPTKARSPYLITTACVKLNCSHSRFGLSVEFVSRCNLDSKIENAVSKRLL